MAMIIIVSAIIYHGVLGEALFNSFMEFKSLHSHHNPQRKSLMKAGV